MTNRIRFLLLIFLIFSIKIFSQNKTETLLLTIDKAKELAIQNNTKVINSRIDVDIAKKKVWETTAIGLPQVNGSIAYQNILSELPTLSFGPGPAIEVGEKQNATYSLTASQLVFSGPYIIGLQASKTYKELSQRALISSELDIKEAVTQSYYLVLIAKKNLEILNQNKDNIQKIVKETEAILKAGLTDETNLDQLNLNFLNIENAISSLKRQYEISLNLLKYNIGLPLEKEIELAENFESLLSNVNSSGFDSISFNVENNISFQLLETQEKLSNLSLRREKTELLPSISAFATYQQLHKEPQINFTPKTLVGVNVSIPVFGSGMKISKIQQAKLELEKSKNNKYQISQGLQINYLQARQEYISADEKFKNETKNKDFAEKIYNNTLIKFKEGIASSMELTQAQTQLLTSQSNYFNALFELLNAKNKLDKLLTSN